MLRRSTSTHASVSALMLRACGLPSTTLEPEERRRAEQELWGTFEVERPCILGALLDSVVKGLKRLPDLPSKARGAASDLRPSISLRNRDWACKIRSICCLQGCTRFVGRIGSVCGWT